MVTAILDTNVFVRATLRRRSPSANVLLAYVDRKFELVISEAVLEELFAVLLLPDIRALHGWTDNEILRFVTDLPSRATLYPGNIQVPASLPRDVSDVKFLSL